MSRCQKKIVFRVLLTILFLSPPPWGGWEGLYSQNKEDSLLSVLKNQREDSNKALTLNDLAWNAINYSDYAGSKEYSTQALQLSEKLSFKKGKFKALNTLGVTFKRLGNYPEALNYYLGSLKMAQEMNDQKNIGTCYNNMGILYGEQGNFNEALKNHFASLEIKRQLGDKFGVATAYNNIGLVYYDKIIKGGELSKKQDSLLGLTLKYQQLSLKMMTELKNKKGIAMLYNNLGNAYMLEARNSGDNAKQDTLLKKALANHLASLKIKEEMSNKQGIVSSYINIGNVFSIMKQFDKAHQNLQKALQLSIEIGEKDEIKDSYLSLMQVDTATKNYRAAFEDYKQFILYRDSLENESNTKKIVQSQMQFEFDKKESETKAQQEKKDLVSAEEKRKQQLILWFTVSGLLIIAVLAIIILRSLVMNKKKNRIINLQKQQVERQKHMAEEKQKEVLDSIHYARRIQLSLLTSEKYIGRKLKELSRR
jgi:tetratricopeptide (TPR) repeat protein